MVQKNLSKEELDEFIKDRVLFNMAVQRLAGIIIKDEVTHILKTKGGKAGRFKW